MMWRLVLSNAGFDHETVFYRMTWDEIEEANAALDLYIEAQKEHIAMEQAMSEMKKRTGRR